MCWNTTWYHLPENLQLPIDLQFKLNTDLNQTRVLNTQIYVTNIFDKRIVIIPMNNQFYSFFFKFENIWLVFFFSTV